MLSGWSHVARLADFILFLFEDSIERLLNCFIHQFRDAQTNLAR